MVDRTVFGLFNKGWLAEFDDHQLLTKETRRTLAQKINERLDTPVPHAGKRHLLRAIIQMQARSVATFLRGEHLEYQPFEMTW